MAKEGTTRYFSENQEKAVCKLVGEDICFRTSNSGAGLWRKGDAICKKASMLIECKTCTADKDSFSIKKEWFEKNNKEKKDQRLLNSSIAFNFGPNQKNYFIIDENLFKYLIERLIEENEQ